MSSREYKPKRSAVVAWVIYDMGNTLFLAGVVGLLFPLWLTGEMSGDDATFGFTMAIAMAITLVLGPAIGAFSDQTSRKKPFLAVATSLCVATTFSLGGNNLTMALVLFAAAVVAFNLANIFYNTMLMDVSTEMNRGTIGGLGGGVGYLGAIIAAIIGLTFVESRGYALGFRAIGLLIILFSLPLFALLKERGESGQCITMVERFMQTFIQLKTTPSNVQRFPGLVRFLIARFWYTWTVNTSTTFAVLYATGTVGFSDSKVALVMLVGILVAIPSAFFWGVLVDRVGPRRSLNLVLIGWVVNLSVAVGIPWLNLPDDLWWGVGIVSGVLVAGTWAADRPYMLRLISQRYLGEFFGLHSMTGRLSAITGPFTWGLLSVTFGLGQPVAVLSLAVCAVIAFAFIRGVSDEVRTWPADSTSHKLHLAEQDLQIEP